MQNSGSYGEKFYKIGDKSNKSQVLPPKAEKYVMTNKKSNSDSTLGSAAKFVRIAKKQESEDT